MKQQIYEWTFENIKNNPQGFINFIDNELNIDNHFNLFKSETYPINLSNETKIMINQVRKTINGFFDDKEVIDYFQQWKYNYIEDYLDSLLIDIETHKKIEDVLMENKDKYKQVINKIMKTTYEKTKTTRYDKYMCFESILKKHQQEMNYIGSDKYNLSERKNHIQQWNSAWLLYLSCKCIFEAMDIKVSKRYVADSGLSYSQLKNNFLNQMDLLIFEDSELIWKEVYKCLSEFIIAINYIKERGGE